MTAAAMVISEEHLRAATDAVLGIDPAQAPTEPAELNERLTVPQPGLTEALTMLLGQGQARHLRPATRLVYVLAESAVRAFPDEMQEPITAKTYVTSLAAVGPEAKDAVSAKGSADPAASTLRQRQPAMVSFVDGQVLGEQSWTAKLTQDERTGVYALCLGVVRAVERHLAGAEKPVVAQKLPGRNDPCHCGSGKKFKKCCGGAGVTA
jgi:hypothetical protein